MTDPKDINYVDPLEGTSNFVDGTFNAETKSNEDEDDDCNSMALIELATCVETDREPIEFTSTDAMLYPKTGLLVCILCLEDVEMNLLSGHMVNAHGYRKVRLRCQLCGVKFVERSSLARHKQKCRPPPKRQKRKTLQQIIKELDSTNALTPSSCPICAVEIPPQCLKDHLNDHSNDHNAPDSLTCRACNRTFKNTVTLREHVKLVHQLVEDTVECETCGHRFRSQKYLSNHRRNVHPTDNKVHTCPTCDKTFKSRLSLHQHRKLVHPPPAAAAPCPHCPDKVFKSKANLRQHLRVSHGQYKKEPDLSGY